MQAGIGVDRVLYLYGVIPRGQELPNDSGVVLHAVYHTAIAGVVEPVCAREFSAEALDEHLQSIEWVARMARRHEAVLEKAMRHGPVIPARLCTLFSDAETLARSLAENEGRFLAALERVRGREEWGLKAFAQEDRIRIAAAGDDPELRVLDSAIATASPGHAFVLRKKREAQLAELTALRLEDLVDQVLEDMELSADDLRLRPLLPAAASGRDEPMALNVAALVSVAARETFRAATARLAERFRSEGLVLELSGPWPAYSFSDEEDYEGAVCPEPS